MPEVPSHVPKGYDAFLRSLKLRIREAQLHASLSVNRELIFLYWQIGRDILGRQKGAGWGAKVIDRLAADLRIAFPDVQGFSPRNLKYMRAFARAWPDEAIVQAPLAQILCKTKSQTVAEYALRDTHKPIGISEYRTTAALPDSVKGSLPTIEELEAELQNPDEPPLSQPV